MNPSIRKPFEFDFDSCPDVPTYEAGYLAGGNGDWRSKRPVIDHDACIGCFQCYLYCPDGAISRTGAPARNGEPVIAIDYDFCKGCGICASLCKPNCLQMEDEPR